MGITATVIDPSDMGALERCLEEHKVSLFFSESPTNPYLRCVDIRRISQLCHAKGAIVSIDSTFATPINQRAIEFGADLVIHSATKYLGGHNDVLAGECTGVMGGLYSSLTVSREDSALCRSLDWTDLQRMVH